MRFLSTLSVAFVSITLLTGAAGAFSILPKFTPLNDTCTNIVTTSVASNMSYNPVTGRPLKHKSSTNWLHHKKKISPQNSMMPSQPASNMGPSGVMPMSQ